jgi:hypothetical protein
MAGSGSRSAAIHAWARLELRDETTTALISKSSDLLRVAERLGVNSSPGDDDWEVICSFLALSRPDVATRLRKQSDENQASAKIYCFE